MPSIVKNLSLTLKFEFIIKIIKMFKKQSIVVDLKKSMQQEISTKRRVSQNQSHLTSHNSETAKTAQESS